MRTIQELAREAISIQDASNIRGLLRGAVDATDALSEHFHSSSIVRSHPVTQLWAHKIASLAGLECLCEHAMEKYSQALRWCSDNAHFEEVANAG